MTVAIKSIQPRTQVAGTNVLARSSADFSERMFKSNCFGNRVAENKDTPIFEVDSLTSNLTNIPNA